MESTYPEQLKKRLNAPLEMCSRWLAAAGFEKSDIVYVDIAFSDLSEVSFVNEIYMGLFPEGKRPARTIYEAAALPFGGKVKIVAIAVKDNA